jgi:calmodulin
VDVLRAVGLNPTEQHVQELLEEYDADNSGALSFAEFARLYVEELESVEEADKSAFQFFDKDGNGEISLVEFRQVLTQLGDPMPEEEVNTFFKLVDRNNDGKLQYDEFLEMVLEGNSQETPGKKKGPGIRARIMASSTDAPGSPTKGARRDKAAAKRPSGDAPLSPPGTANAKK